MEWPSIALVYSLKFPSFGKKSSYDRNKVFNDLKPTVGTYELRSYGKKDKRIWKLNYLQNKGWPFHGMTPYKRWCRNIRKFQHPGHFGDRLGSFHRSSYDRNKVFNDLKPTVGTYELRSYGKKDKRIWKLNYLQNKGWPFHGMTQYCSGL